MSEAGIRYGTMKRTEVVVECPYCQTDNRFFLPDRSAWFADLECHNCDGVFKLKTKRRENGS